MLAAAYRNLLQWSEFIGGDVVLTIPSGWQKKINSSDIKVEERISTPVKQEIIDKLYSRFEDFRKAYDEDGLSTDEFEHYGAVRRTLRQFLSGYAELLAFIRDYMVQNPDVN